MVGLEGFGSQLKIRFGVNHIQPEVIRQQSPIARDKVVDTMEDLLIVIDSQYHIVDLNSAAEKMLKVNRHDSVGQEASELLS